MSDVTFGRAEAEAMMEEYGYCKHSDCRALVLAAHDRGYVDALATHPLAAAVLQQEAGEPVAWQVRAKSNMPWGPATTKAIADHWLGHGYQVRPLYATPQVSPPQARVPLTEWPIAGIRVDRGTVVIVAKGNVKYADEAACWMCGELLAIKDGAA